MAIVSAKVRSYQVVLDGTKQNLAEALNIAPGSGNDVSCHTMCFRAVHPASAVIEIGGAGQLYAYHLDPPSTPVDIEEHWTITNTHGCRLSDWDVKGSVGDKLGVMVIT